MSDRALHVQEWVPVRQLSPEFDLPAWMSEILFAVLVHMPSAPHAVVGQVDPGRFRVHFLENVAPARLHDAWVAAGDYLPAWMDIELTARS